MKHDELVFVKAFGYCIELLDEVILLACEEVYQDGNFVYQQDGAPAHRYKDTQSFLEERAPQFIRNYDTLIA